MIRSFKSEWVKLSRRTFVVGALAAIAFIGLLGTLVPFLRDGENRDGPGAPGAANLDLEAAGGAVAGIASMSQLVGAVALVIGAIGVANEYTHGTLKNLLIRQPRRLVLLAGKLGATATFLAGLAAVTIALSVGFSIVAASIDGVDMSAWFTSAGVGEIFGALGGLVLANWVFGIIGVALAVVMRSAATAIGIGLAWALPGEQLIAALWSDIADFLPGHLAAAISGSEEISFATAVGGSIVWIVAFTVLSMAVFNGREVAG